MSTKVRKYLEEREEPVLRLVPVPNSSRRRKAGSAKGMISR